MTCRSDLAKRHSWVDSLAYTDCSIVHKVARINGVSALCYREKERPADVRLDSYPRGMLRENVMSLNTALKGLYIATQF